MKIHLIGVCGTAMATLAALMKHEGFDVQGSDQNVYPPMSEFLEREGIRALAGYRAEHITPDLDLVVVGNAISRGNAELEEVLDRKVRFCSLPEAVRDHFLWTRRSVVIAGTHGKTTTTALAGWLLAHAGRDPGVLVGGIAANFDASYRRGSGPEFVIEGDEYDSAFFDKTAKFLKYLPEIAVVGNIEFDHADIYPDLDAVLLAFRRFVNLVPRGGLTLLGGDCPRASAMRQWARSPVRTFGLGDGLDWQAVGVRPAPGGTAFRVLRSGEPYADLHVPLLGDHNVRNALAALAIASHVGIGPDEVTAGMAAFKGVKRRLELRGTASGVTVYDDFAHHPTAIAETLAAVRGARPGARLWAIFEPRSATSCRRVFQQGFTEAFDAADETLLAAVFRSTLPEDERLDAEAVVAGVRARGHRARYVPTVAEIVQVVAREARDGDLVVVMSNGGFDGIHDKLLAALASRRPPDAPA
jgi:UDP-N-acetylmuramate: L-alanyl-gamma-D-glutamyl-meso-diaminopimelate ligase